MSWSKYTSKDAKVLWKVLLKDVFQLWKVVQQLWKFRYLTFQSCQTLATFTTLQLCKVAKVAQSWSGHFPDGSVPERDLWQHQCGSENLVSDLILPVLVQVVRCHFRHKFWERKCDKACVFSRNPVMNPEVLDPSLGSRTMVLYGLVRKVLVVFLYRNKLSITITNRLLQSFWTMQATFRWL